MKRVSKLMISGIIMVSMIAAVTACGSSDKQADSKTNNGTGQQKVNLTLWHTYTDPTPRNNIITDRMKAFQNEHPNINLTMEAIPHDQYKIKLKTQAAGKELPDLFDVWPGAELQPLVSGKLIMPIDEIIGQWSQLLPKDQLTDYAIDGKQYAIPFTKQLTSVVFYDKDMLMKAGYTDFPKTYDDFKAMIGKLKETGVTPIALGNKGKWVLQSCYMSTIGDRLTGSDFLANALGGKDQFTNAGFIKGLGIIKEMADMKAFNDDANSLDNTQQRDLFLQGKAAMFVEGTWAVTPIMDKISKDRHIGLALFPSVSGGKGDATAISGVTGGGIGLNANLSAEKKAAAFEFLKYMYSDKLYKDLLTIGELVPANIEPPTGATDLAKEALKISKGKIAPVYDAVLPPTLTDTINNGLQALTLGKATPEQLADEMQKALQKAK